MPRVVITGIGIVSSIGITTEEFWRNALAGQTVVESIPKHWYAYADYKSNLWSPLPEIDYRAYGITRTEHLQRDPVCLLGYCAAHQALDQSQLHISQKDKRCNSYSIENIESNRGGVFIGSGVSGVKTLLDNYSHQILARNKAAIRSVCDNSEAITKLLDNLCHPKRVNPFVIPMIMPNAVSASLGIKFNLHGPNQTHTVACASGTAAIGHAYRAIRAGQVDFALTGGCEYISENYGGMFYGFDVAKTLVRDCAMPDKANRPFDKKRSGFLYSEGGAAILVLEEYDHARSRGASIVAEVMGYAETFDAYSMLSNATDGTQIERMILESVQDAGIDAHEIDYLNAHGTGTETNDLIEVEVIRRVFAPDILVNSTKSLLGHSIGASGAIEVAVTALSLKNQTTHICRNLDDPIADLNFVYSVQPQEMKYAFTHSFAFGGHNTGLVLKRYEG